MSPVIELKAFMIKNKNFMFNRVGYIFALVMLFMAIGQYANAAWQPHPLSRQDSATIKEYRKAHEDWKNKGDLKEASRFLNQIAIIYWEHNFYREAISYYEKSKGYNQKIGNENGVAMIHNNLAMIYSDLMDYKRSLDYFDKTLAARRSLKQKIGIISALINRSVVLNNLKRFNDAVKSLEEALSLAREDYDLKQMKSCYLMLAETFEKANMSKASNQYYELYRQMNEKVQSKKLQKKQEALKNAELKAKLAESERRNKELELIAKERELEEKDRTINEFSTQRERLRKGLTRRDLEVRLLRQEAELEAQRKEQQKEKQARKQQEDFLSKTIFGMIFVFVLVFTVTLWRSNQVRKRTNKILAERNRAMVEQKNKIEEQNHELNAQKEYLVETLDQLKQTQNKLIESEKVAAIGNLVAGVAHEINTPVGVGITLASDMMDKTEGFVDLYKKGEMKRSNLEGFLQNSYEASKLILSNLERTGKLIQNFRRVSVDEAVDVEQQFDVVEYVRDVVASLRPKYKKRPISISLNGEEKMMIKSYPGVFAQIITNLLVNSLKYAFDENQPGKIDISVSQEKADVILEVKDDGKGIPPKVQKKIYEPFFTTDKNRGTGLGLHITYNLVTQRLSGNIDFKTQENKGTSFIITIPINSNSYVE